MATLVFSFTLSTVFCLLLAIGLLASRALNPLCARMLGLNYLLFALQKALGVLVFTDTLPEAALVRAPVAMLLGPALYGYFISALRPADFRQWRWQWHLLPAVLMAWVLWQGWGPLIDPLIIASFAGYWLTVLWQLQRATRGGANTRIKPAAKTWLWILVAVMAINIIVEFATAIEIHAGADVTATYALRIGGVVFALFHALTLVLALMRAPVIEWMHELRQHNPSNISDAEKRHLFQRWQALVEEKELHLSEQSITLTRAARLLGVPARHLSKAINSVYGGSFSQYLNDVRVERARALLQEHPDMSITDVFMQAGFSTKSHFHREFSRVVGSTPSAYRDQVAR